MNWQFLVLFIHIGDSVDVSVSSPRTVQAQATVPQSLAPTYGDALAKVWQDARNQVIGPTSLHCWTLPTGSQYCAPEFYPASVTHIP